MGDTSLTFSLLTMHARFYHVVYTRPFFFLNAMPEAPQILSLVSSQAYRKKKTLMSSQASRKKENSQCPQVSSYLYWRQNDIYFSIFDWKSCEA